MAHSLNAARNNTLIDIYPSKARALVYGFLTEINKELEIPRNNIPTIIPFTCLLYGCIRESFTTKGEKMNLYPNQIDSNEVYMRMIGTNTVYGKVPIEPNGKYIYEWVLKVMATNYQWFAFSFGIDSSKIGKFVNEDFSVSGPYGNSDCFYAFGCDGARGYKFSNKMPPKGKQYGEGVTLHDTVTIKLNSLDRTIEFFKNNKSLGIAFNDIDCSKQYHFAVSMRGIGRIKLVSFQQTFSK